MKYKAWLGEWLELYIKPSVKGKTYRNYEEAVRLHISPQLGENEMDALSGIILQKYVISLFECGNVRTGKGLSAVTVGQVVSIVQRSLNTAVQIGYLEKQYSDRISKPKAEERLIQVKCFTKQEQRRIEEYVSRKEDTKLYGILLTLYTGLRIGELIALTWEDIDFERGMLSVNKTCRDSWGGGYCKMIGTPKTPSSYRLIPIPKQILPYLRRMKRKSTSRYVVSGDGKEVSVRSYQRTFSRILARFRIPHRGFHALRHTFATRAIENNIDIKTLAEVMGHKSPAVTLAIYAHSLAPHKKMMMNRLGKLLHGTFLDEEEE